MANIILRLITKFLSHQMSFNDCIEGKKCAYFNGQSYLSVDTLANSFHTWKKFTISLWYKADHLATMGLLTNGFTSNGCSSLPTITMTTTNGQLNSHVALKDKAAQLKGQVCKKLNFNKWIFRFLTCLINCKDWQIRCLLYLLQRFPKLKCANYFWSKVIPNEWNHVCLIRDDDVISMYVNAGMTDEQEIKGDKKRLLNT